MWIESLDPYTAGHRTSWHGAPLLHGRQASGLPEQDPPPPHQASPVVVSTGRIDDFVHLPSLRICAEWCDDVAAVASRDADRAKAFASRWGIPRVHPSWQALLHDPEIDAVVLCPPSDLILANPGE